MAQRNVKRVSNADYLIHGAPVAELVTGASQSAAQAIQRPGATVVRGRPVTPSIVRSQGPTRQQLVRRALGTGQSTGNPVLDMALGIGSPLQAQIQAQNKKNKESLAVLLNSGVTAEELTGSEVLNSLVPSRDATGAEKDVLSAKVTANAGAGLMRAGFISSEYQEKLKKDIELSERIKPVAGELSKEQRSELKKLISSPRGPGGPEEDAWKALKLVGDSRTTQGLTGKKDKDAEILNRLMRLGFNAGPIIRQKFTDTPFVDEPSLQREQQEIANLKASGELTPEQERMRMDDLRNRVDKFYADYAAAFVDALNRPTGQLGNKPDIDTAKRVAQEVVLPSVAQDVKNYVRQEQMSYRERDRTLEKQAAKEREAKKLSGALQIGGDIARKISESPLGSSLPVVGPAITAINAQSALEKLPKSNDKMGVTLGGQGINGIPQPFGGKVQVYPEAAFGGGLRAAGSKAASQQKLANESLPQFLRDVSSLSSKILGVKSSSPLPQQNPTSGVSLALPKSHKEFQKSLREDTKAIVSSLVPGRGGKRALSISPHIALERSGLNASGLRQFEDRLIANQNNASLWEDQINRSYLKTVFESTGLDRKYAQLLADYGSTKNKALLGGLDATTKKAIIQADKKHRTFYDSLLKELNLAQIARGENPTRKLGNYYAAPTDRGRVRRLLESITPSGNRGQVDTEAVPDARGFFENKRGKDTKPLDALLGTQRYSRALAEKVFLGDSAARYKHLSEQLSKKGASKNVITTIDNIVEQLTGNKKTRIPTGAADDIVAQNRSALSDLGELSASSASRSQLGLSPTAVAVQTLNAFIGTSQSLKNPAVLASSIKSMAPKFMGGGGVDYSKSSRFLNGKYRQPLQLHENWFKKAVRAGFVPMRFIEERATRYAWNLRYGEARAAGQTPEQAIISTDREIKRMASSRAAGDQPAVYQARVLEPITKFTYEAVNNVTYLRELARQGKWADLAGALAGLEAYNYLANQTLGYSPVFTPGSSTYKAAKKTAEGDPVGGIGELAGSYLSQRPLGLFPAGAYQNLVPEDGLNIGDVKLPGGKELFGDSQLGRFGVSVPGLSTLAGFRSYNDDGQQRVDPLRGLGELATKAIVPTGGQQILRMISGAGALASGEVRGKSGDQQFVIEDKSLPNVLQTLFLGPYRSKEGREQTKKWDEARRTGKPAPDDEKVSKLNEALGYLENLQEKSAGTQSKTKLNKDEVDALSRLGKVNDQGIYFSQYKDQAYEAIDDYFKGDKKSAEAAKRGWEKYALLLGNIFPSVVEVRKAEKIEDPVERNIAKQKAREAVISDSISGNGSLISPQMVSTFLAETGGGKNLEAIYSFLDQMGRSLPGDERSVQMFNELVDHVQRNYIPQASNQQREAGSREFSGASKYLNTAPEIFEARMGGVETMLGPLGGVSEQTSDLAKQNSSERSRMFRDTPNLLNLLDPALRQAQTYTQSRADKELITQGTARSTKRAIDKLLGGDFSTSSSSGGGRRGGKRGGRKGRKGSVRVKKAKAGRKTLGSLGKKPKTQSNVLNFLFNQ